MIPGAISKDAYELLRTDGDAKPVVPIEWHSVVCGALFLF